MAKGSYKKSKRNELGRTPTEQAAWDRLQEKMAGVLSGEIRVKATGYNVTPINVGTGTTFSGQNATLAGFVSMICGDNRFIGAQEALKRGWNIKGAKGFPFLRPVTSEKENEEGELQTSRFFKTYYLLNLAHIEHDLPEETIETSTPDALAFAERCLKAIESVTTLERKAVTPHHGQTMDQSKEWINIPPASAYDKIEYLISSCLHELGHFEGRGHPWLEDYTKHRGAEELVAESVALIVMTHFGFDFSAKNATYIKGWATDAQDSTPEPIHDCFKEASKRAARVIEIVEAIDSKALAQAA